MFVLLIALLCLGSRGALVHAAMGRDDEDIFKANKLAAIEQMKNIVSPVLHANTIALAETLPLLGTDASASLADAETQFLASSSGSSSFVNRKRRMAPGERRVMLQKCAARNASRPCSQLLRVSTAQGVLQGYYNGEGTVRIWQKIAYAQPPVGQRRFQKAVLPVETPNALYWATSPAPACPQLHTPMQAPLFPYGTLPNGMSEDCLYLNVFAPGALVPRGKYPFGYPVYVWLHGGMLDSKAGNSETFNGESFAKNDVIVVAVQYRLGVLGLLATDGLAPGDGASNAGLLDQALALQWVKTNIIKFGGNPDAVTVGGQGVAAAAIGAHMYQTNPPFRHAILQSPLLPSDFWSPAWAQTYRTSVANSVNCTVNATMLACLRAVPVDALLAAQAALGAPLPVQGVGEYVSSDPMALVAGGLRGGVATLIGFNANDGDIFLSASARAIPKDFYNQFYSIIFSRSIAATLYALYPWLADTVDSSDVFGLMYVDSHTYCPLRNQLRRILNSSIPTTAAAYVYQFAGTLANDCTLGLNMLCASRSCHTLELMFAFNTTSCAAYSGLLDRVMYTHAEQQLASRVHSAWVNFIHTGNPNTGPRAWNLAAPWPALTIDGDEAYRFANDGDSVVTGLRAAQCEALPSLIATVDNILQGLGM